MAVTIAAPAAPFAVEAAPQATSTAERRYERMNRRSVRDLPSRRGRSVSAIVYSRQPSRHPSHGADSRVGAAAGGKRRCGRIPGS